mmetsp:Transcript_63423/g.183773  ORF Transcript_63423/g.183773 Transcript_63423/m.183773 type:complete len:261 (-) Transcript_63423:47-829(-)
MRRRGTSRTSDKPAAWHEDGGAHGACRTPQVDRRPAHHLRAARLEVVEAAFCHIHVAGQPLSFGKRREHLRGQRCVEEVDAQRHAAIWAHRQHAEYDLDVLPRAEDLTLPDKLSAPPCVHEAKPRRLAPHVSADRGVLPSMLELQRSHLVWKTPNANKHSPWPPPFCLPSTCRYLSVMLSQASPRVHCEADVRAMLTLRLHGLQQIAPVESLHARMQRILRQARCGSAMPPQSPSAHARTAARTCRLSRESARHCKTATQ